LNKIISLILILLLIPVANAITGSIGNAKAIIKTEVEPGKTTVIERTILVKNVNNVSLNITLEPDEGLKDIVQLIDEKFVLQPKEEKKARFNLNIDRPGNYSGRISVFFSPGTKEAGVVLASSLIINAYGKGDFPEEETPIVEENTTVENETVVEEPKNDNGTGVKVSLGGTGKTIENKINNNLIFIIIMIVILLLIIGGAIYFLRRW